ncbi:MerR family transcriptional regulator [Micromonospora sp. NPDC023814]|uniref:MerR family transcriptional regulator n=1 Tax=Micromonospora sp. NPDC023814 TaxID=3154596 RepID=UPI0033D910B6
MTGLLELAELSARSGVPAAQLRRYAEAVLVPPDRRDGDRFGYPLAEVDTVRALAGAEDLGLDADALGPLAAGRRDGDCPGTRRLLANAVTARLDQVQADLAARNRQAVEAGPGTAAWATELSASASLSEDAARLQAVSAALTTVAHDGPCGQDCGCFTALASSRRGSKRGPKRRMDADLWPAPPHATTAKNTFRS